MSAIRSNRIISFRHRIKQTADNDAHPTEVFISTGTTTKKLKLETDDDELAFITGELNPGERVLSIMGGSGSRLVNVATRVGLEKGFEVFWTPPAQLKEFRDANNVSIDKDAETLARLFVEKPSAFYLVRPRDRNLIRVMLRYKSWMDAMKARIATGQRIGANAIDEICMADDGPFPEGKLEVIAKAAIANDIIYQNEDKEEARRLASLTRALKQLDVYTTVFEPIEGIGPSIAARIIAVVGDIRRFQYEDEATTKAIRESYKISDEIETRLFQPILDLIRPSFPKRATIFDKLVIAEQYYKGEGERTKAREIQNAIEEHKKRNTHREFLMRKTTARFKKYCGLHLVLDDDTGDWIFPRRKRGTKCNWSNDARGGFYQATTQMNYRPETEWGQKLRAVKVHFREVHPEKIVDTKGKTRYNDAHIHRMASWRSATRLAEHICKKWFKLLRDQGLVEY